MSPAPFDGLSRREREVVRILLGDGGLLVEEIRERMEDPPTNPATRSILRGLLEKGRVRIEREGRSYRYYMTEPEGRSRLSALADTVRSLFGGSIPEVTAALAEVEEAGLSEGDAEVLTRLREALGSSEPEPGSSPGNDE